MDKKKVIAVLILLIFFFGCIKEEKQVLKDYKIVLNSQEFDFESKKINIEVYSQKELPKTRFEILNQEKKLKCFDYFDLKKGKNILDIACPNIEKKLFLEITPSDGKTKEFEIEIEAKQKITLKKGFKYEFTYKAPDYGINYEIFILDENIESFKAIAHISRLNKYNKFDLFLIDKNSYEIYSSGPKDSCYEIYEDTLEKRFSYQEVDVLFPFMFIYLQNNSNFKLEEFLKKKYYAIEDLNNLIELRLVEKIIYNFREVYKVERTTNNENKTTFYIQAEKPHILIYYENYPFTFEFKTETKEEFNREKYNCFSG